MLARAACVVLCALAVGCRRDAAKPIAVSQLFPDATIAPAVVLPAPSGGLARAEAVAELEPNDSAAEAQPVAANAVVDGVLARPPTASDKPARTNGHAKAGVVIDEDWYRLPAVQPGQMTQIDLASGPACAELELYDDTGRTLVRRAKWWKAVRPVLPSVGPAARASLVRVVCRGKSFAETGGSYRLAVWTRASLATEEVEPNDKVSAASQTAALGASLQGSLAPLEDVDAYSLDFRSAQPGDCLQISVAGVPDVDMELALYDPLTLQPLMRRKPARGLGIIVPNLDVRRVGDHPIVTVRAVSGNQPDAPYVLSTQEFLPSGCAHQVDCPALIPVEREPNDDPARALAVLPGTTVTGFVDSAGDIDWLAPQARPGQIAVMRLIGPSALKMALSVQGGAELTADAGQPLRSGAVRVPPGGLMVGVHAQEGGASLTDLWRFDVQLFDFVDYEVSVAPGAPPPDPWSAAHALLRRPVTPELAAGGWTRHGMIDIQNEIDVFGLDLRDRPAPVGLGLLCGGDGALGMTCTVSAEDGRELVKVTADLDGTAPGHSTIVLVPGRYRIAVQGAGRRSPQPYAVMVREQPDAQGLPLGGTPTDAGTTHP